MGKKGGRDYRGRCEEDPRQKQTAVNRIYIMFRDGSRIITLRAARFN